MAKATSSNMEAESSAAGNTAGILYLVATPIGNLDDIGLRALSTLRAVNVIAAEDTRHSRQLLTRHGIGTPMVPLHEHNEHRASDALLTRLSSGESVAVVSDAGTPLISDPGLPLVRKARAIGIRIVPIPGACAAIAALAASGLAVDRFVFEGFPPRSPAQRRRRFESLLGEQRTLVFYESSHRVRDTVRDLAMVFEASRHLVIARELTKLYENIVGVRLDQTDRLFDDPNMTKGEFVLILEGASASSENPIDDLTAEQQRILKVLLEKCPATTASSLAARITGGQRDLFYRAASARSRQEGDGAAVTGDHLAGEAIAPSADVAPRGDLK